MFGQANTKTGMPALQVTANPALSSSDGPSTVATNQQMLQNQQQLFYQNSSLQRAFLPNSQENNTRFPSEPLTNLGPTQNQFNSQVDSNAVRANSQLNTQRFPQYTFNDPSRHQAQSLLNHPNSLTNQPSVQQSNLAGNFPASGTQHAPVSAQTGNQLSSLEQRTQMLVSQINAQFNLNNQSNSSTKIVQPTQSVVVGPKLPLGHEHNTTGLIQNNLISGNQISVSNPNTSQDLSQQMNIFRSTIRCNTIQQPSSIQTDPRQTFSHNNNDQIIAYQQPVAMMETQHTDYCKYPSMSATATPGQQIPEINKTNQGHQVGYARHLPSIRFSNNHSTINVSQCNDQLNYHADSHQASFHTPLNTNRLNSASVERNLPLVRHGRHGIRFRQNCNERNDIRDDSAYNNQETRSPIVRRNRPKSDLFLKRFDSSDNSYTSRVISPLESNRHLDDDRENYTRRGSSRKLQKSSKKDMKQISLSRLESTRTFGDRSSHNRARFTRNSRKYDSTSSSRSNSSEPEFNMVRVIRHLGRKHASLSNSASLLIDGDKKVTDEMIIKMGELKLAEQVMEQQKSLIEQSQELIKLQQIQLEHQIRVKESTSKQSPNLICRRENPKSALDKDGRALGGLQDVGKEIDDSIKNATIPTTNKSVVASPEKRNTKECPNSEPTKANNKNSLDLPNEALTNEVGPSSNVQRQSLVTQQNLPTLHATRHPLGSERIPRCIYDLSTRRSPIESSDSDFGSVFSQCNTSSHPYVEQAYQKNTRTIPYHHPTGLHTSQSSLGTATKPHHMHQSKFANKYYRARDTHPVLLRSAPIKMLGRSEQSKLKSCGMTRIPLTPADLIYEISDSQNRKVLPVTPSHSVPLTPSMVRKMAQAHKATTIGSRKLLTSVDLTSTLLSNANVFRNPYIDNALNTSQDSYCKHDTENRRPAGSMSSKSGLVSFYHTDPCRQELDRDIDQSMNRRKYPVSHNASSILKSSKVGHDRSLWIDSSTKRSAKQLDLTGHTPRVRLGVHQECAPNASGSLPDHISVYPLVGQSYMHSKLSTSKTDEIYRKLGRRFSDTIEPMVNQSNPRNEFITLDPYFNEINRSQPSLELKGAESRHQASLNSRSRTRWNSLGHNKNVEDTISNRPNYPSSGTCFSTSYSGLVCQDQLARQERNSLSARSTSTNPMHDIKSCKYSIDSYRSYRSMQI